MFYLVERAATVLFCTESMRANTSQTSRGTQGKQSTPRMALEVDPHTVTPTAATSKIAKIINVAAFGEAPYTEDHAQHSTTARAKTAKAAQSVAVRARSPWYASMPPANKNNIVHTTANTTGGGAEGVPAPVPDAFKDAEAFLSTAIMTEGMTAVANAAPAMTAHHQDFMGSWCCLRGEGFVFHVVFVVHLKVLEVAQGVASWGSDVASDCLDFCEPGQGLDRIVVDADGFQR